MSRTVPPTNSAWALVATRLGQESDGSIARDLQCSSSTVRNYRNSLGISAFGAKEVGPDIYPHLTPAEARTVIDIVGLDQSIDDGPTLFRAAQSADGQRKVRRWGVRIYDFLPLLRDLPDASEIVAWAREMRGRLLDRDFLSKELQKFSRLT